MTKLTFFDTNAELEELTGLNDEQLWNNGFCLDDWDWGFVTDSDFGQDVEDECGFPHFEYDWTKTPGYMDRIFNMMENYCVGYEHVEYNGRHYFLQYHA